jgi:3-oxoacyl-[acyl-carrier protein] reductase
MTNSLLGLEDKAVIVTGAGQGLGRGIALQFARAGARLALADLDAGRAEAVAAEIRALGRPAIVIQADVRQEVDIQRVIDTDLAAFERLDVAVNNAGGLAGLAPSPVLAATTDFWDTIVEQNLRATFLCCRAFARAMVAQGTGGAIVNIAAIGALRGSVNIAPYGAAKAGIIQLTKTLAVELGPHGIRVNCVAPGRTETPALAQHVPPEMAARTAQAVPLGRIATPEDIAGMVLALASDLAAFTTGQTLAVDGGLTLTMNRPAVGT